MLIEYSKVEKVIEAQKEDIDIVVIGQFLISSRY